MIEAVKLNRPQRRELAKQGVDFLEILGKVTGGKGGTEDVTTQDLIGVMDAKSVDAIVDLAYPNHRAALDDMSEMELIELAIATFSKSFSGVEVAGKSPEQ
jgi:hypothetical protein